MLAPTQMVVCVRKETMGIIFRLGVTWCSTTASSANSVGYAETTLVPSYAITLNYCMAASHLISSSRFTGRLADFPSSDLIISLLRHTLLYRNVSWLHYLSVFRKMFIGGLNWETTDGMTRAARYQWCAILIYRVFHRFAQRIFQSVRRGHWMYSHARRPNRAIPRVWILNI